MKNIEMSKLTVLSIMEKAVRYQNCLLYTSGTVDERYVLGRAVCVLLPFQNFGMIPEGEQTR